MIVINIDGLEPVAKGRARSTKSGHHYTPTKTRKFEAAVRAAAVEQMREKGCKMIEGGVIVDIVLSFSIPASWPKWKKEMALNGEIEHTKKPDATNCGKSIEDALNGVLWEDDSQIMSMFIHKMYSSSPGIYISATESRKISAQTTKKPK